jgi:hypothetical protein
MTDPADRSTDERTDGGAEDGSTESDNAGVPWYDATTFEAGDGDAAAIGRAVDAAADDGGGTVLLPTGEYRLKEPVKLRSGVHVRGAGTGATTLSARGAGFAAFEGFGSTDDPLTDLAIEDLAIDCTGLGGEGYDTGEKCIYLQYVRRCRISGVYAHGAPATGIGTDFMVESLVHGCVAERNGRFWEPGRIGANGIGIGAGRYAAETVVVSDCHAVDNGNNGVMFEAQGPEGEDVHSGLLSAVGCTSRGNRIGFRDSADRRVKFVGCSAAENDESGVVVSGKPDTSYEARGHRIADCHLVDNAEHGVSVIGAANRSGIAVDDCTIAGNGGCGVSIDTGTPVGGVSIDGCAIHDNGACGVLHRGGGRDVSIVGCSVRGDGTGGSDGAGNGCGIRLEAGDGRYRGVTLVANRCHELASGITLSGPHEGALLLGNDLSGVEDAIAYDERPDVLRNNLGHRTEAGGRTTVADGDRIEHGLAEEPSFASVEPRSAARAVVREVDDDRIVVGLVDADGGPIDDAEPVLWEARTY